VKRLAANVNGCLTYRARGCPNSRGFGMAESSIWPSSASETLLDCGSLA